MNENCSFPRGLQNSLQIKRILFLERRQKEIEKELADLQAKKEKCEQDLSIFSKKPDDLAYSSITKSIKKELADIEIEKEKPEKMLTLVNGELNLIQSECSHVGMYIGSYDGIICKCVLCNSKLNSEQAKTLAENGLVVYASNFVIKRPDYSQYSKDKQYYKMQNFYRVYNRDSKSESDKEHVAAIQKSINYSLGCYNLDFNAEDVEKDEMLKSYQDSMESLMNEEFNANEMVVESEVKSELDGPVRVLKKDDQGVN